MLFLSLIHATRMDYYHVCCINNSKTTEKHKFILYPLLHFPQHIGVLAVLTVSKKQTNKQAQSK